MIVLIVIVIVIIKSPMMSSQMPQMTRQCGHSDPRTLPESSMGPPRALPGHPMAQREGPGGGRPQCRGVSPPLLAPSGAPRDPFLSPRFGTGIGTASAASFGNTQLRHRTGRGAPEHVNMGVESMSTMSLLGRPGVTHRPFLDSQLDPPRALFGHPRRLNPQRLNGTMPRGEKDPVIPSPGLQVPIKALGSGASFNKYIYIYIYMPRPSLVACENTEM